MISLVSASFHSQSVFGIKQAVAAKVQTTENLAAASKLATSSAPEYVTAFRTRTEKSINANLMQNLSGALTYSQTQASSLKRMAGIVEQLSGIVTAMQNSVQSEEDLNNYMIQFNALRQDLVQARKEKYGDTRLHDTTATSTPLKINLDGSTSNVLDLTQSNFIEQGAGALLALLGSSLQDFEASEAVNGADTTDYGGVTPHPPTKTGVATGAITGEEGWGTESTNSPQALIKWGVQPLENLLSAVSQLLSVNASQQLRIEKAIEKARERDRDLSAFENQITDVDVAFELANLAKSTMTTESGLSAMAQANVSAESVAAALYGGAGAGIKWMGEDFSRISTRADNPVLGRAAGPF